MLITRTREYTPAFITLRLKDENIDHKTFGYAMVNKEQNLLYLYHADRRRSPALIVPMEEVESVTAEYR